MVTSMQTNALEVPVGPGACRRLHAPPSPPIRMASNPLHHKANLISAVIVNVVNEL